MDEVCMKPDSDILPNECAMRVNGGVDRISRLPNELLFVILSYLPVRKAASTTVLSSRWLDLWKQIPNLKFNFKSDRISQLPDHILLVILSFLRLKDVVATSVLSSRWSDLWKLTPSLSFDPFKIRYHHLHRNIFCGMENIEVVNSVIRSHKAPSLEEFKVDFCVRESANCSVAKWLEFMSFRKVQSLVLNFRCADCDEGSNKVVLEESLREMIRICGAPSSLIFFQSLESLHLDSLKVSGEDIKLFLRNCPLLRILKIHFPTFTSDVEICGSTDLMLQHLDILLCEGERSIKVSVPNLRWITLDTFSWKALNMINAPQLWGAEFRTVFAYIPQLTMLKLNLCLPEALFKKGFPHMPLLTTLVIECRELCFVSLLPVTDLISACPLLEEFTLKVRHSSRQRMGVMKDVERSRHQNLKVFTFQMTAWLDGDCNDQVVELVTYIWENCVALRKVILGSLVWRNSGIENATDVRTRRQILIQQELRARIPNHIPLEFRQID